MRRATGPIAMISGRCRLVVWQFAVLTTLGSFGCHRDLGPPDPKPLGFARCPTDASDDADDCPRGRQTTELYRKL